MASTTIQELNEFGQSAWLDNINRAMITSGKLKEWIGLGLRGSTSDPSILDKAICKGVDYDEEMKRLSREGKSVFEVYDDLTVMDIQDATDMYRPIYEESGGLDGYVSLEINPKLARKAPETIEEGRRLYQKVNRPNAMFKVPSTDEGFEAIEELIASGVNVNITLVFSLGQYIKTAQAYMRGMERYVSAGGDARNVASVASVFVSRVDTAVDKALDALASGETDEKKRSRIADLRGKAAVANAALIYAKYLEIIDSDQHKQLEAKGVRPQRVLWGSTSTKDSSYSDIKYVTELIASGTVNTLPDKTFEAFLDHGVVSQALTSDITEARQIIHDLKELGIDVDEVCAKLLEEGVVKFEDSFDSLLGSIEAKVGNASS
jgi:transaldolase